MTPADSTRPLDLETVISLIGRLTERVEALEAENTTLRAENATLRKENAALREKLDLPPKTPANSSTPPSKGQKPSETASAKAKSRVHAGTQRALHPAPTRLRTVPATHCQHCRADVSGVMQVCVEAYDHIELPHIEPDVTRVRLMGGECPCCRGGFKAPPPPDMTPGSPFGPNLRACAPYLRYC